MPESNPGSNGTAKTSERVFPARSLVKSPHQDLDNPFNKIFGRKSEPTKISDIHEASPLSQSSLVESGNDMSVDETEDESIETCKGQNDTNQRVESQDSLKKTFSQLDRVKDNQGTAVVQDVASTHPVEHEVEDDFEFRTERFSYIEAEDGSHKVKTGLDEDKLQACEDEPIHIPGAVQGFGVLMTLRQIGEEFQIVHNSNAILGLSPSYLFGLKSFTEILPPDELATLSDQLEFLEHSNSSDLAINADNTSFVEAEANVSPEVFLLSGHQEDRSLPLWKCWTAMHRTVVNVDLIIVEFELQKDDKNPLTKSVTKESPATSRPDQEPERGISAVEKSGMSGNGFDAFSEEDLLESTVSASKPLRRVRRSVMSGNEDGSMEIFSLLSQMNGQLSDAVDLQQFLKVVAGLVKEITGFHRVMIYQFDEQWNGQVVAELVDWDQTKDLFQGLSFPATDIPVQARTLYKLNKVRTLYDRDQPTARLVCRDRASLEVPLDMTHCFLRAMSPIHLKYLANMGVRGSMSISITAFGELWGLIACHTYGETAMRCSFLTRKLCRLMGEQISHNIERLSYAARLTARKLIHTPSAHNPSGYIVSKAEDLLGLFDADIGMLSIGDEGKLLGAMENSQEAIALREYFRSKRFETITPSSDLRADFPDLTYAPGFKTVAGVMYIPLSRSGEDFLLFFRRGQLRKVHWAGNPYEKVLEKNKGQASVLLPRQSFKVWSESVVGRCKEWGEDQIETAAVLCLVYGKFIEVWREKQQVAQTSKLTSLLLNNAGHEVRTPLNAVINYLEIAMEGNLPNDVRENLEKSHMASKSLVYVINDLLDLTKSEQGHDLFRSEPFELLSTVREAVSMYRSQADRSQVQFFLEEDPSIPRRVLGDQAKIRQVIGNVTANALKYTTRGSVTVKTEVVDMDEESVQVAIIIEDTGCGISEERLDAIFSNFELVEAPNLVESRGSENSDFGTGLGLAIVARVVRNMNGQLKAVSKVGRGSTFTFMFHFSIAQEQLRKQSTTSNASSSTARKLPQQSRVGESSLNKRTNGSDAKSDVSGTSGVEVDEVSGQRTWPSEQRHHEAKERIALRRRTSLDSKGSQLKQQINTIHQLTAESRHASSQSNIDDVMASMINTPLPTSDNRSGSHEGLGSRHMGSNTGSALSEMSRAVDQESVAWSKNGSVMDNSSMFASKQDSRNFDEREHGRSRGHELNNTHDQSGVAEASHLSHVHEDGEGVEKMSDKVVNTRTRRHMRGVKLDSQEVVVPQRYERNLPVKSPLTPNKKQISKSAKGADEATPTKSTLKPLDILVAEDDAINRSIIQKRLQIDKHKIKLAFHGADCYDEYAKDTNRYDVILMDMQMPVLDGMGATRKIRALEASQPENGRRRGRVPIIAVSASLLESQASEAIEAGIDGWILKPVDFGRLREFFEGLQNQEKRRADLYASGTAHVWEKGGWLTNIDHE